MKDQTHPYDDVEYPDLPSGWSWWSGSRGGSHYTRWFGTDYRMGGDLAGDYGLGGFDAELYWDRGNGHHVHLYPILGFRSDGDPKVGEYPVARGSYDTAQEAIDAVPELITSL